MVEVEGEGGCREVIIDEVSDGDRWDERIRTDVYRPSVWPVRPPSLEKEKQREVVIL